MNKLWRKTGITVVAKMWIALAAAVCSAGASAQEIRVGVIITATGPAAAIGVGNRNTVDLMPRQIAGVPVRYITLDDGGDPGAAVQGARKLIDSDKVDVIMGPLVIPACVATAAVVNPAKTPQLCFGPVAAEANPYQFSAAVSQGVLMAAVVENMKAKGIKSLAYLGFSDSLGEVVKDALRPSMSAAGINFVADERFARTDTSVGAQVLKVLASRPDAIFVGATGSPAALPMIALAERGFKGQVYLATGAFVPDFIRLGGKAVEGAIAPMGPLVAAESLPDAHPVKRRAVEFKRLYDAKFGPGSTNYFAGVSWDESLWLVEAATQALKKAKPGTQEFRVAIRDALEGLKDFAGANSVATMTPKDHVGMDARSVVLQDVRGGAFQLLK